MEQLLLINPSKRPSKRRKARRATSRTSYRKAAAPARRAAPVRRRRRRTAAPALTYAPNPIRRRSRRRAAAKVSHRRRYRRNPSGRGMLGGLMPMLMEAFQGAAGAVAVNAAMRFLPLPASMKTGIVGTATKAGVAVALGIVGKKMGLKMAHQMAAGALTMIAYDTLNQYVTPMLPGMSGLGYYPGGSIMPTAMIPGDYAQPAQLADMSAYVTQPGMSGMGEYVGMEGFSSF